MATTALTTRDRALIYNSSYPKVPMGHIYDGMRVPEVGDMYSMRSNSGKASPWSRCYTSQKAERHCIRKMSSEELAAFRIKSAGEATAARITRMQAEDRVPTKVTKPFIDLTVTDSVPLTAKYVSYMLHTKFGLPGSVNREVFLSSVGNKEQGDYLLGLAEATRKTDQERISVVANRQTVRTLRTLAEDSHAEIDIVDYPVDGTVAATWIVLYDGVSLTFTTLAQKRPESKLVEYRVLRNLLRPLGSDVVPGPYVLSLEQLDAIFGGTCIVTLDA